MRPLDFLWPTGALVAPPWLDMLSGLVDCKKLCPRQADSYRGFNLFL